MSDPNWQDWQEERFDLPAAGFAGSAYEYLDTVGFILRPMTAGALKIVARYFFQSDEINSEPEPTPLGELPTDTPEIIEARSKIMDWLMASRLIDGTILYDGDSATADVEIITLAEAITRGYSRSDSYPDEPGNDVWLVLHLKGSAILQLLSNASFSSINNTGVLNLTYYALCCSPTPPSGSLPPGFEPPGTNPTPTPAPSDTVYDLDCATHEIYGFNGTNHTSELFDYGISLGLGILNLLPVADQYFDGNNIKPEFDTAIAAAKAEVSAVGDITSIKVCYAYACGGLIQFQVFDVNAVHIQSTIWNLLVKRGSEEQHIVLPPTNRYGFTGIEVPVEVSGLKGVANLTAEIYTAENQPTITIDKWNEVTELKLYARCLGTVPAGIDQIFTASSTTPAFDMGLAQITAFSEPCLRTIPYSFDFTTVSAIPDCWLAEFYNSTYHGLNFEGNPGYGSTPITSPVFVAGAYTVDITFTTGGTPTGDFIAFEAYQTYSSILLSHMEVPISSTGLADLSISGTVDGSASANGLMFVVIRSSGKVLKSFSIHT